MDGCNKCGYANPPGRIVCLSCYYEVGAPHPRVPADREWSLAAVSPRLVAIGGLCLIAVAVLVAFSLHGGSVRREPGANQDPPTREAIENADGANTSSSGAPPAFREPSVPPTSSASAPLAPRPALPVSFALAQPYQPPMRLGAVCRECGGNGRCLYCTHPLSVMVGIGSGRGGGPMPGVCATCRGSGRSSERNALGYYEDCRACRGTGKCQYCGGTGKCDWCNGTGMDPDPNYVAPPQNPQPFKNDPLLDTLMKSKPVS